MYSSLDYNLLLWNLEQKKIVSVLQGHTDTIICLRVSRNDEFLVSASEDKTVRLWSLESKRQLAVISHSYSLNTVVISTDNKYIVSNDYTDLKIWRVEENKQECILTGHEKMITSIAMTTDNKYIISGSYDGTIRICNFHKKSQVALLSGHTNSVSQYSNIK